MLKTSGLLPLLHPKFGAPSKYTIEAFIVSLTTIPWLGLSADGGVGFLAMMVLLSNAESPALDSGHEQEKTHSANVVPRRARLAVTHTGRDRSSDHVLFSR